MAHFLDVYLSSFWAWAGITVGLWVVGVGTAVVLTAARGKW